MELQDVKLVGKHKCSVPNSYTWIIIIITIIFILEIGFTDSI